VEVSFWLFIRCKVVMGGLDVGFLLDTGFLMHHIFVTVKMKSELKHTGLICFNFRHLCKRKTKSL